MTDPENDPFHVIDWQAAMVCLFGNLTDVKVTIKGDGTTNIYSAYHLPTGTSCSVTHPRQDIHTAGDQETQMIRAMEKLQALLL